jgi:hypothetical protein
MLNENQNNQGSWKNKFEELEALQDQSFDKEKAWAKLHNRLGQKNPQKKRIAYWTAAACLVVLVSMGWFFSMDKDVPVAIHEQQKQNSPTGRTIASPAQPGTKANPESTEKKQPAIQPKNKRREILVTPVSINTVSIPDLPIHPDNIDKSADEIGHTDSIAMATVVPPKKKLRVIHINELGELTKTPVKFVPRVANDDLSGFTVSRNASDNIIKIKLSPSN